MSHTFLEPIQIGNVTVKNRVMFLAMAKTISNFDGSVSQRDIDYIESVAAGGVGIVIPGAMIVDPTWPSVLPLQPGLYDDRFIPRLRLLVKAAHKHDAKILFQLWHPGATNYSGVQPKTVDELTVEEIKEIEAKFVAAAKRAMAAGADGVEFQTCHGYLACQFISPLFNHRTDEYGWEKLEDRTRFAVETLTEIRRVIGPNKILSVKMQGFDYPKGEGPNGQDGITPEQAAQVAPYLEKAGADVISVSAGGTIYHQDDIMSGDVHRAEGWKVPAAELVKKTVSIPVAATGSIRHPDFVDQIIGEGKVDMVGMGRGILAEREWVKKCAEGREDELRYCISCMNCFNVGLFQYEQTNCSVNPFALREGSKRPFDDVGDGRVVAIIGAGPAGMEAAVTLKQRGFTPVVFDKGTELGGNLHIAKKPPFKGKFEWAVDYYKSMFRKLGIETRLGKEVSAEEVLSLRPYSVLVATGSNPMNPPIPGLDQVPVYQSHDVLVQDIRFEGKKIVVLGGGITGLETALFINRQGGNEVFVVDMLPEWPVAMTDLRYQQEALLEVRHCNDQGVKLFYDNKVVKHADGKIIAESTKDGHITELPADVVIMSLGVRSNDALYQELLTKHPSVWKAGDALAIGKINKAVLHGSKFGYALT